MVADFSPISVDFEDAIKGLKTGGTTLLWDAIEFAQGKLETVRRTGTYPNAAHWRVLVFSDGNDEGSRIQKIDLTNRILASQVFVDSVHLTTKAGDESGDLARLSQITGGFAFRPTDPADGLRIFEKESFLSAHLRPPVPRERGEMTEQRFNAVHVKFEDHIDNTSLIHITRARMTFQTGARALAVEGRARVKQGDRGRRVLDEMLKIMRAPIAGVEVYMQEGNIFEWKTFIEGPRDTVYGRHIWPLTLIFGEGYPGEPPLLRFSVIPYHMNVSEDGIVCIDSVTTRYVRELSVRNILEAVVLMFREPQPRLAVQIEKFWNHRHCLDEYEEAARVSGEETNNDMKTWLTGVKIEDDKTFVIPPQGGGGGAGGGGGGGRGGGGAGGGGGGAGGGGAGGGGGDQSVPQVLRYEYPDRDTYDPMRLFEAEGSLLIGDDDDDVL
jgi:ubiquitin-protein ligase